MFIKYKHIILIHGLNIIQSLFAVYVVAVEETYLYTSYKHVYNHITQT